MFLIFESFDSCMLVLIVWRDVLCSFMFVHTIFFCLTVAILVLATHSYQSMTYEVGELGVHDMCLC